MQWLTAETCGDLEHRENDVMSDNLFCSTAAQQINTNRLYIVAHMTAFWQELVFLTVPALPHLKGSYLSAKPTRRETLAVNVPRHHGNESSGCRDFALHEAAAQCASLANAKEGPSAKLFPVLRETKGDGKICSRRC